MKNNKDRSKYLPQNKYSSKTPSYSEPLQLGPSSSENKKSLKNRK